jgi:hypothetical protein
LLLDELDRLFVDVGGVAEAATDLLKLPLVIFLFDCVLHPEVIVMLRSSRFISFFDLIAGRRVPVRLLLLTARRQLQLVYVEIVVRLSLSMSTAAVVVVIDEVSALFKLLII